MSFNLRIARVQDIDVYIHWTFWLLPLWVILTWQDNGTLPLWMYLMLIAALFLCVVLHELGHALMAREFGIRTRNITLSPLGGIAQLERMSKKPSEEVAIAVAGPLVNLVIALLLGGIWVAGAVIAPWLVETQLWYFLGALLALNVVMVLFNMIPAFPMDGGRVLRAILASSLGRLQGTRVAVTIGAAIAILLGFAGLLVFHNPWMPLIALFVILAGRQELALLEMEEEQRRALEGPRRPMNVTICLWDPVHRTWVRRTYADDV